MHHCARLALATCSFRPALARPDVVPKRLRRYGESSCREDPGELLPAVAAFPEPHELGPDREQNLLRREACRCGQRRRQRGKLRPQPLDALRRMIVHKRYIELRAPSVHNSLRISLATPPAAPAAAPGTPPRRAPATVPCPSPLSFPHAPRWFPSPASLAPPAAILLHYSAACSGACSGGCSTWRSTARLSGLRQGSGRHRVATPRDLRVPAPPCAPS